MAVNYWNADSTVHCKKVNEFPVPSRDITTLLGSNLIIPGRGEFG